MQPALYFHRSSDKYQHRHGGSNVTYLTGMFQHFLPDMRHTLRDNMRKAFRRADWTDDIDRLGIRSVQYLSFEKAGLKAHMEGVRARKEAAQEKQKYFVVYPDEESKRQTLQQQTGLDEDSDEAMAQYLHGSEGSTIVAYISLSDRNNFAGTNPLIVGVTVTTIKMYVINSSNAVLQVARYWLVESQRGRRSDLLVRRGPWRTSRRRRRTWIPSRTGGTTRMLTRSLLRKQCSTSRGLTSTGLPLRRAAHYIFDPVQAVA